MFTQLATLNLQEVPRGAIIVCVVLISLGLFLLSPIFDKNRKHYPHGAYRNGSLRSVSCTD